MPARLSSSYEEALADARRVELNDELALVIARNQQLLNSLYSGESDGLWMVLRKTKRQFVSERAAAEKAAKRDDKVSEVSHRAEAHAHLDKMLLLIEQGAADTVRWQELMNNVEGQRRLSESERKRRVEEHQIVTTEEVMALMGAILAVITRHVKDERVRRAIGADLDGLVDGTNPGDLSAN